MGFIWPPLLLLLLAIPVGVWVYRRRERRRAGRAAAFGLRHRRSRLGRHASSAATRGAARRGCAGSRPPAPSSASRSSSCRSPGRRASSASRGWKARSSSPSTSPAAWPPTTSRPPGWRRPRRPRWSSSSTSRPRSGSASSCSAMRLRDPGADRTTGSPIIAAIQRLEPERGTSLGRGIIEALTVIQNAVDPTTTDYYTNSSARADARPDAGPGRRLRAGRHRAADRRREHRRAGSARGGAGRQGSRHPDRHRRDRHRGGHDPGGRGLQGPHQLEAARPAGDRRGDRRHVLRRDQDDLERDLRRRRQPVRRPRRAAGGDRPVRGVGFVLLLIGGGAVAALVRAGRAP